jgi:hypothetical protein
MLLFGLLEGVWTMPLNDREKLWNELSLEEKVEDLRSDVSKLFSIDEEFGHKNHVFVDAIGLVHARLDKLTKTIQKLEKKVNESELADY